MSLYGALASGVSGLAANSNAMGMISDNIANVNTVGYKSTEAAFSTLVTGGNMTTNYSSGGVQAIPQNLISAQGLLQASNSPTDLSIDGAGFFAVSPSPANGASGGLSFTRAGSFTPDANGYLVNTAGLYLMGYPLDSAGNPPQTQSVSNLVPITLTSLTGTAEPTTTISPLRGNLQSSQAISAQEATYNAAVPANNMASGAVAPDFTTNIQVYDSLGTSHNLTLDFLKSSTPNQWHVEITSPDAVAVPANQVAAGTLAFNTDGSLDLTATSPSLTNALNVNWSTTGGAAAAPSSIKVNWGTNGKADGFTQYDTPSTLLSSSVDGASFGNVNGVSISKTGVVTALFDNGLSKNVYQLPVATFQNPDGLTRSQGNSYTMSDQSGSFAFQTAGTGGAGTVAPSTLEASTVDLSAEFTNLITAQQSFSADSKILSTVNNMLSQLDNVIR